MAQTISRPLDLLNCSKNKQVIVELTSGKAYAGTLIAFDIHINIVLDNAREIINGEQTSSIGQAF